MSIETKICSKCGEEKELCMDNFYFRKGINKWRKDCKTCCIIRIVKYRENNDEKVKICAANYIKKHKNEIKKYNKKWYENNKNNPNYKNKEKNRYLNNREYYISKSKEYAKNNRNKINERYKIKKKLNIQFAVKERVRSLFKFALKQRSINKNRTSTFDMLPYTVNDLIKHLESQFESWMNWSNWGQYIPKKWNDNDSSTWTWQLDHVIPQSEFKYQTINDPEFLACWKLENLRPLKAKDNIIEGTNRTRHKVINRVL